MQLWVFTGILLCYGGGNNSWGYLLDIGGEEREVSSAVVGRDAC